MDVTATLSADIDTLLAIQMPQAVLTLVTWFSKMVQTFGKAVNKTKYSFNLHNLHGHVFLEIYQNVQKLLSCLHVKHSSKLGQAW
jgi:hypothetical protein